MAKEIDWNAPAIPPQEGKRYVRRNGSTTMPVHCKNGACATGDDYFVNPTGYVYSPEYAHSAYDLIAEYIPPKPTPQVGEWWITRDGNVAHKISSIRNQKIWCGLAQWTLNGRTFSDACDYASDLVRRVEIREIEGEK